MTHLVEPASTGRAKCRGCNRKIAKGELRFGERQPNAFGEGEMTLWFHLPCAAYKRPEPLLEALPDHALANADRLAAAARSSLAHPRLPRLSGAERAPTGRARCRACRNLIEQGAWRIPLSFWEEFRSQPSGFIHAACAREYFGTTELLDRIAHFSPDLSAGELDELKHTLG
jgi:hypothetical protein